MIIKLLIGLNYYHIIVMVDKKLGEYCNFFYQRWVDLEVPPPYKSAALSAANYYYKVIMW